MCDTNYHPKSCIKPTQISYQILKSNLQISSAQPCILLQSFHREQLEHKMENLHAVRVHHHRLDQLQRELTVTRTLRVHDERQMLEEFFLRAQKLDTFLIDADVVEGFEHQVLQFAQLILRREIVHHGNQNRQQFLPVL